MDMFFIRENRQVIFCKWQIVQVCGWWECAAIGVVVKSIFSAEINVADGKRIVGVDWEVSLIGDGGKSSPLLNILVVRLVIGAKFVAGVGVDSLDESLYWNLWEVKVVWYFPHKQVATCSCLGTCI